MIGNGLLLNQSSNSSAGNKKTKEKAKTMPSKTSSYLKLCKGETNLLSAIDVDKDLLFDRIAQRSDEIINMLMDMYKYE
ncbi:hypothetical protein [Metamycoplasma buccale]|uniref:hypothetical protein n=1 Tax=Metamycoplasma buccale TaxID=55602 RepID=UPI00398F2809